MKRSGKVLNSPLLPRILWTFLLAVSGLGLLWGVGSAITGHRLNSRQAEVAAKGAQVMPFDLEQTTHQFEPLPDGGLQTVTVKDAAEPSQIALIQQHLQEEAAKFQAGDFSDPAAIHGHGMPGLKQLSEGASDVVVEYKSLPDGGQIRYTTSTGALISALHDWFAAQRSDHGRHAH